MCLFLVLSHAAHSGSSLVYETGSKEKGRIDSDGREPFGIYQLLSSHPRIEASCFADKSNTCNTPLRVHHVVHIKDAFILNLNNVTFDSTCIPMQSIITVRVISKYFGAKEKTRYVIVHNSLWFWFSFVAFHEGFPLYYREDRFPSCIHQIKYTCIKSFFQMEIQSAFVKKKTKFGFKEMNMRSNDIIRNLHVFIRMRYFC